MNTGDSSLFPPLYPIFSSYALLRQLFRGQLTQFFV
jgi:hypothetical protein